MCEQGESPYAPPGGSWLENQAREQTILIKSNPVRPHALLERMVVHTFQFM